MTWEPVGALTEQLYCDRSGVDGVRTDGVCARAAEPPITLAVARTRAMTMNHRPALGNICRMTRPATIAGRGEHVCEDTTITTVFPRLSTHIDVVLTSDIP